MKEAGEHLKSVSVAVKRIEVGDRSSSLSGHGAEDEGLLGPRPHHHYPPPPPPPPPLPPFTRPQGPLRSGGC